MYLHDLIYSVALVSACCAIWPRQPPQDEEYHFLEHAVLDNVDQVCKLMALVILASS